MAALSASLVQFIFIFFLSCWTIVMLDINGFFVEMQNMSLIAFSEKATGMSSGGGWGYIPSIDQPRWW
jgi:hypothetical protein